MFVFPLFNSTPPTSTRDLWMLPSPLKKWISEGGARTRSMARSMARGST